MLPHVFVSKPGAVTERACVFEVIDLHQQSDPAYFADSQRGVASSPVGERVSEKWKEQADCLQNFVSQQRERRYSLISIPSAAARTLG